MKIEIKNGYIFYNDNPEWFIHESGCVGHPSSEQLNSFFKEAYKNAIQSLIPDFNVLKKIKELEDKKNENKN